MDTPNALMFLLHVILFLVVTAQTSNKQMPIGVILDLDTLAGKVARTSVTMALEDFYTGHWNYSTRLVLYTRDSNKDNLKAISRSVINLYLNVQILLMIVRSSKLFLC